MRSFQFGSVAAFRFLTGLLWLSMPLLAAGEELLPGLDLEKVEISLVSHFPEALPDRGTVTLDFRIRNFQDRPAVWSLQFLSERGWQHEKRLFSERRVEVEAKSAKTLRWEIPLVSGNEFSRKEDSFLSVGVRGPGATGQSYRLLSRDGRYGRSRQDALVLVSPALSVNEGAWQYSVFEKQVDDNNEPLVLSPFELDQLPERPTGLAGVDVMMMTGTEWDRLRAVQPLLLSWVAGGGQLLLRGERGAVPEGGVGAGRISRLGPGLDAEGLIRRLNSLMTVTDLLSGQGDFRRGKWRLADGIREIKPSFGLIMLMVIAVAGLLGPLNIWISFRKRNSLQIIWTTPLISLGLSLLVGAGIVISDGFGGKGERALWVLLMPEQAAGMKFQEQIARTGVLLGNRFELPEGTEIYNLPPDRSREKRQLTFSEDAPGVWSGDWFENRTVQAQALRQLRSNRASVRFQAGEPPVVLSNVDAVFSRMLVRDAGGGLWYGENIRPGEAAGLRAVNREREKEILGEIRTRENAYFPGPEALNARGWFYAESEERGAYIDTLPSIKWRDRPVWYLGPLQMEAQP